MMKTPGGSTLIFLFDKLSNESERILHLCVRLHAGLPATVKTCEKQRSEQAVLAIFHLFCGLGPCQHIFISQHVPHDTKSTESLNSKQLF
jgi:hypothetical protein